MKAYHNDSKIKTKYVNRVKAHAKADQLVKGQYWKDGKGCAVGCTVHSGDHKSYETELGIPQWMAKLEDRIFEGLPNKRAMTWPIEFLQAIKPGMDLQKCFIPMLIFIVESAKESARSDRSKDACEGVLIELRKDPIDITALRKARDAADAVNTYAAAAAYVVAAVAATVAVAAAYAAAVYVAEAEADAVASRSKTYVNFADKLLELIRDCEPKETADE